MSQARELVRSVRVAPLITAAAIVTLGLGIAGTTAIFSVVNGVLIKPLPYPAPDALVRLVHAIGGIDQPYFSDAIYLAYVDNAEAFDDIGVWSPGETVTIAGHGDPEEVRALRASRGLLTTLGVRPELGRWLSPADDTPGSADTVIITSAYWQQTLAGERSVLERTLAINGRPHQIVGVMPADFQFDGEFDIVLPLKIDRAAPTPGFRLLGVARLRQGVTLVQANADVSRLFPIWVKNPAVLARWAPALRPLKQDVVGDVGTTLWTLLGAIAVVLLIACANVANLLLVRGFARSQEFAIRTALGATWTRIARSILLESLALALVGGICGVAIAHAGLRLLLRMAPTNLPRVPEISIDPVVLSVAFAVSLISGVLFALTPIVRYARSQGMGLLGLHARGSSLTPSHGRSQQVLVAAQIALALVLVLGAAVMMRSFSALRSVSPGFVEPGHVQTFTISIPAGIVAEPERVVRIQHAVLDSVRGVPGVSAVAFTTRVPMGSDRSSTALAIDGRADEGQTPPDRQVKIASPELFQTLGIPLAAGRDFTWTDVYDTRPVAIVSENLARELFGSAAAALGRRVREYYDKAAPWLEIVGVSGDVHDDGADQPPPGTIYWPAQPDERLLSMSGYQARRVTVAVRTDRAGRQELLPQLREAVRAVAPTVPVSQVRTLDEVYGRSMARTSFTLVMLGIGGAMALVLSVSGIYGLVAYTVARRGREIGIRLAVGAQRADISRLFMRRALAMTAIGVAAGLGGAAAVTRLLEGLLFGIDPLDPVAFAAAPVLLVGAAVLASYLAVRRATGLDPVDTLRE